MSNINETQQCVIRLYKWQTDCTPHPEDYTPPPPVTSTVCFTADQVRRELMKLNSNKVLGPDGVSPRVLKAWAPQLCGVLHHVFGMSLSLQRVEIGVEDAIIILLNGVYVSGHCEGYVFWLFQCMQSRQQLCHMLRAELSATKFGKD